MHDLFGALRIAPLVAAMCCAGLLGGLIMPSRDMLVRAAAPPGAMGRTFGIVTSGFGMGGMVGPLMFGFAMDHGAPQWVFGISVILMIAVAVIARLRDPRASAPSAAGLSEMLGTGRGRPSWRVLLIGLGVIVAWLLVVMLLTRYLAHGVVAPGPSPSAGGAAPSTPPRYCDTRC